MKVIATIEIDTAVLKENEYEGSAKDYLQEVLDNGDTEGAIRGVDFK